MSDGGRGIRKRSADPSSALNDGDYDDENADNYDDDYALKRQRNNAAVNKTRQKKRQEELSTQRRVQQLKDENAVLERKLESMRRELDLLKEMVVACAAGRRSDSSK